MRFDSLCTFAIVALFHSAPAFCGQAHSPPPSASATTPDATDKMAHRFPQPVRVADLIGRDVLQPTEAQQILGHVTAVVRKPDDSLAMIVAYGGFLGIGTHPIAVPVKAMALLGEHVSILDIPPEQLAQLPADDGAKDTVVPTSETIRMALVGPFH